MQHGTRITSNKSWPRRGARWAEEVEVVMFHNRQTWCATNHAAIVVRKATQWRDAGQSIHTFDQTTMVEAEVVRTMVGVALSTRSRVVSSVEVITLREIARVDGGA